MEKNLYLKEEKLYLAFKMFDKDGNGKISAEELKDVLGSKKLIFSPKFSGSDMFQSKDDTFWDDLIKDADLNGDGEVN
jgi:calcium-dependent protein kinase